MWLDASTLSVYLDAVVAAHGRAAHVLLGPIGFTTWVKQGAREYETGFGYDCGQALMQYKRRIKPTIRREGNATSLGPFTFAAGYLIILSQPLVAALSGSHAMRLNMASMRVNNGSFGTDDFWLGSAVQRFADVRFAHPSMPHSHAPPRTVFVSTHSASLASDQYGLKLHSTTVLWHIKKRQGMDRDGKDMHRLHAVHNFSRVHACLRDINATRRGLLVPPLLTCSYRASGGRANACSPPNSTWCTFRPICEPRRYEYDLVGRRGWRACDSVSFVKPCRSTPDPASPPPAPPGPAPCCTAATPEPGYAGRCFTAARARIVGCKEGWMKARCPVACGKCVVCPGHRLFGAYRGLYRGGKNGSRVS